MSKVYSIISSAFIDRFKSTKGRLAKLKKELSKKQMEKERKKLGEAEKERRAINRRYFKKYGRRSPASQEMDAIMREAGGSAIVED